MIASRIEIRVAAEAGAHPAWRSLGFVSFSTNEKSRYSTLEMKSVMLPGPVASLVRLVCLGCHKNELNTFRQVGLLRLQLRGTPVGGGVPEAATPGRGAPTPRRSMESVGMEAFAAPSPVSAPEDVRTPVGAAAPGPSAPAPPASPSPATRSHPSTPADLDSATAQHVAQLERLKAAAVAIEDYDEAKRLKGVVDRLRALGGKIAALEARKAAAVADEDYDLAKQLKAQIEALRRGAGPSRSAGLGSVEGLRASLAEAVLQLDDAQDQHGQPAERQSGHIENASREDGPGSTPLVQARRARAAPAPSRGADAAAASRAGETTARAPRPGPLGAPPPGFPEDLPAPEPLSAEAAKDAAEVEALCGPFLAACFFARAWQLREAALRYLLSLAERGVGSEPSDQTLPTFESLPGEAHSALTDGRHFGAAVRLLRVMLQDRVLAVFQAALPCLLFLTQRSSLPKPRLASGLADAAAILVDKAGDSNPRVAEAATETVLRLVRAGVASGASLGGALLAPIRRGAAARAVLGRLALAEGVLAELGVGGAAGLPCEGLAALLGPAFEHSAGDIGRLGGPQAQARVLPPQLNPKLQEAIQAGNAATGAPSPAAGPGGHRDRRSTSDSRDRHPAERALFAAELAAREARYGPDHAEVADALSNLAIVYNQRGDVDAALPLYRRALRIWERALGPDHLDVAQTLTDIAVIHLEKGEDAIGRPLLARALDIQEAQLGPNHPDVVAIRDVLEEGAFDQP
ncbi:hypothetical protein QBZ16_001028 [Prototheca wickerhamii]|uniref:Kinesin light chain n=1 Tax=Prototheca wickerhamii TaxID=3111 RepID=A0AAD9MH99_PROWI|nr:hypothetical protein QBZ16_001028 [Prototheca wickerhamii]